MKPTTALVLESARSCSSPCGDTESSDLNRGNDGWEYGYRSTVTSKLCSSPFYSPSPTPFFLRFFLLLFKWVSNRAIRVWDHNELGPSLEEDTNTLHRMRPTHLVMTNDSDVLLHITAEHSRAERKTLYGFSGQVKEVNQMKCTWDGIMAKDRTGQVRTGHDITWHDMKGHERTWKDMTWKDSVSHDRSSWEKRSSRSPGHTCFFSQIQHHTETDFRVTKFSVLVLWGAV